MGFLPERQGVQLGYSAGGSSSASAVVVALGEVDMAIGDQGGPIRMPFVVQRHPRNEADMGPCAVNESVGEATKRLASLGAILEWISTPAHLTAAAVWRPIGTEGMTQTMMYGDGYGLSRSDLYSASLMAAHRGQRDQADSRSETAKMLLMLGTCVRCWR